VGDWEAVVPAIKRSTGVDATPDDGTDDGHNWEMLGIAPDGDPEDVIEVDPEQAGGVEYRRLRTDLPPPD